MVQSPDSPPNVAAQVEEGGASFSTRLQDSANMDVVDKVSILSKKINLEGNHDSAPNPLANNCLILKLLIRLI
jgi:hypothetical protein